MCDCKDVTNELWAMISIDAIFGCMYIGKKTKERDSKKNRENNRCNIYNIIIEDKKRDVIYII